MQLENASAHTDKKTTQIHNDSNHIYRIGRGKKTIAED